jgi:hypothetical protein
MQMEVEKNLMQSCGGHKPFNLASCESDRFQKRDRHGLQMTVFRFANEVSTYMVSINYLPMFQSEAVGNNQAV